MWKNGKPAEEVTEQMAKEQAKPGYIGAWKNESTDTDGTDIDYDSEKIEIATKKEEPIDEA